MKKRNAWLLFGLCLPVSLLMVTCSGPGRGLFASKTPHEKYADKLSKAGLKETELGRSWMQAATRGLQQPLSITLPYKETGYFPAEKPEVAGYRFSARRGDQLVVKLVRKPAGTYMLFLDLWQVREGEAPRLLQAADSVNAGISAEIRKDGDYQLRLQPELLAGGEYTLTIQTAPSLAFPVETQDNPRIGSFWGDTRDAGARSHEGIDIFSKFRTPAVAAADGTIRTVGTNRLGGNIVFLRPRNKDYVLYYAHLDTQLVQQGQQVKAGDTIGLIGNTGNARHTPPHLHFGIYSTGGAVDPLPYVKRDRPEPSGIKVPVANLDGYVRSDRNAVIYASPHNRSEKIASPDTYTLLQVKGATDNWYRVQLPDGREGYITGNNVSSIEKPIRTYPVDGSVALLNRPDSLAATKTVLDKNESVQVLAVYNDYYYVKNDIGTGWILR